MADRPVYLSASAREFVPCLPFSNAGSALATINEDSTFQTPTLTGLNSTQPITTSAKKSQLMADSKPFVPSLVLSTPKKSKAEMKSLTPQTEDRLFIPRIIVIPATNKSLTSLPRSMSGVQQLLMTDDFSEESPVQSLISPHCSLSLPKKVERAKTCPLPSKTGRKKSVPDVQAEMERVCGLLEQSLESISERNLPTKLSQCTRIVFYFPQTLERAAATVERIALGRDGKLKCSLGVLVSFCCALSKQWPSFKNESDGSYRSLATAIVARCKKRSDTIHRLRRESDSDQKPMLQRAWINDLTVICRLMIEFDFRSAGEVSAGLIAHSLEALIPCSKKDEWLLPVLSCILRYSGKRLDSHRRAVVEDLFVQLSKVAPGLSEKSHSLMIALMDLRQNQWRSSRKVKDKHLEQVVCLLQHVWSKPLSKHPLWPYLNSARSWKSRIFLAESLDLLVTNDSSADELIIVDSIVTLIEHGHISVSEMWTVLSQISRKYGMKSAKALTLCLQKWCSEKCFFSMENGLAAIRDGCPELATKLKHLLNILE